MPKNTDRGSQFNDRVTVHAALELGVCAATTSLHHPTFSESVRPAAEALRFGRSHGFHSPP